MPRNDGERKKPWWLLIAWVAFFVGSAALMGKYWDGSSWLPLSLALTVWVFSGIDVWNRFRR